MIDYIDLSSTPHNEECIGVGEHNALALMRIEARAYIGQLKRVHGLNPEGTDFRLHRNPHDFGTYIDIRFFFDEDDLVHTAYAMKMEEGCDYWDEQSLKELRTNGYRFPNEGSMGETGTEESDITGIPDGPTGHGDICMTDADPGL